jgi:hypothetical protein
MNEHERMLKILSGQYPAPTSLVRHLPRVLDRIVMKALHPETTSRYKTALEMAVEVEPSRRLPSARGTPPPGEGITPPGWRRNLPPGFPRVENMVSNGPYIQSRRAKCLPR